MVGAAWTAAVFDLSRAISMFRRAAQTYATAGGGLTFATVRNAGHMVPRYRPSQALYLFATWLRGGAL